VVLKEASMWIEYYYRSVQAGRHYEAFTKDDVMAVLTRLEGEGEGRMKEVRGGERGGE
jgi:hypothetical protein